MLNVAGISKFFEVAEEEVERMTGISHFEKYEDQRCSDICLELVTAVKENLNEECDAYVIGQRVMGLSDGKPEIIIFLDIGQRNFFSNRDYKRSLKEIHQLEKVLSNCRNWQITRLNRSVPTLSAVYKPTGHRCDLSTMNGFSVQISAMIGHFFEIQPEAVKLYHFLRIWLSINKVNFKPFTLTLLVLHYLQEQNLMPSVVKAQKNIPQNYIEEIAVSYEPTRDICSYQVKKMPYYYAQVRGFFRYYSNFNFSENVISTYYGYPVQKDEYQPKLDYDSPMCVAAFLNQKCNTSRHVTAVQVHQFMTVCEASYKYLVENGI